MAKEIGKGNDKALKGILAHLFIKIREMTRNRR